MPRHYYPRGAGYPDVVRMNTVNLWWPADPADHGPAHI